MVDAYSPIAWFLIYTSLLAMGPQRVTAEVNSVTCTNSSVLRQEWRDLSAMQKQSFLNAVKILRNPTKSPSKRGLSNRFADFADIHASVAGRVHSNAMFLVWHREFLRRFEMELQQVDPSVSLPYWDTGYDGAKPLANVDIFGSKPTSMGTLAKKTKNGYCLGDGFCAGWKNADGSCLTRAYSSSIHFRDNTVYTPLILSSPNYDAFGSALASAHDMVHEQLGGKLLNGKRADMFLLSRSANDLLFYLHHANVDRLFYRWQKTNSSRSDKYSKTGYSAKGSINDILPFWKVPVKAVLLSDGGAVLPDGTGKYCIKYAPFSKGSKKEGVPRTGQRSTVAVPIGSGKNRTIARAPAISVSQSWIEANAASMNISTSRFEERIRGSEFTLDSIQRQFDEKLDQVLARNVTMDYEDAYEEVMAAWAVVSNLA
ncbi:hypothetical protein HDU77_004393 [Chytriomyces hyalinus]|nr:hypothetical protein HDU77_004841 [Chytriomyces hyalinus]KAJ3253735.1 hypothetical protein HDU77_004393 [Chytriomyces hyalinus]